MALDEAAIGAPSDFVRTEWIAYKPRKLAALRADLAASLTRIGEMAVYYLTIGDVVLEAERADLELANRPARHGDGCRWRKALSRRFAPQS